MDQMQVIVFPEVVWRYMKILYKILYVHMVD